MFAESRDRIHKGSQGQGLALLGAPRMQRAMRRRKLKALVKRLKQLQEMKFNDTRQLLLKLGEAKGRYRAAWRLIKVVLPQAEASGAATEPTLAQPIFSFRLNRKKLQAMRRREGRYLCAPIFVGEIQRIFGSSTSSSRRSRRRSKTSRMICNCARSTINSKAASKPTSLSPSWPTPARHLASATQAVGARVSPRAPCSISSPSIQMLDVHFPTNDGRTLILSRYTEPNPDQRLLVERLNLALPQPPPESPPPASSCTDPTEPICSGDL